MERWPGMAKSGVSRPHREPGNMKGGGGGAGDTTGFLVSRRDLLTLVPRDQQRGGYG